MQYRRNEFDVTDRVNLRKPESVFTEVSHIMSDFCPDSMIIKVHQAFRDFSKLYKGKYQGYHACDVPYHDLQHVMDVTLASARFIASYENNQRPGQRLGSERMMAGILLALFHDCGYIRDTKNDTLENGAEYTHNHITRGANFLEGYLASIGLEKHIDVITNLIHFTGYEKPIDSIKLDDPRDEILGCLVGSADLLAQMADRCYLEKCRDRLYPEFVLGGMNTQTNAFGMKTIRYQSADDLLRQTPDFYQKMVWPRLEDKFHGVAKYVKHYFGGQDLYKEEIDRNLGYVDLMIEEKDFSLLRRNLTDTPESRAFPYQRLLA